MVYHHLNDHVKAQHVCDTDVLPQKGMFGDNEDQMRLQGQQPLAMVVMVHSEHAIRHGCI